MLTIIDYNLGSVDKVADSFTLLGIRFKITRNENDIIGSEKLYFPEPRKLCLL